MNKTKLPIKREQVFTLILALITFLLFLIPVNFGSPQTNSIRARALIVSTDNSETEQYGIIRTGNQGLIVKILSGKFKGTEAESNNILTGKMELDKMFSPGDIALITIDMDQEGQMVYVNVIDHYRINIELMLFGLFIVLLIIYAGWTGVKAVISFIFTGVMLWKILLPGFLLGYNPILLSLFTVSILTAGIIFLIGGITEKGIIAFLGSMCGVALTCILSLAFGKAFNIHGAIKPFSETLLYSGYPHLDLNAIFLSGIFLASSGAVMDIAMDISASMEEVKRKHPDIDAKELIKSGFRVGQSVIGTMTTTLLLAYSGSYATMMMVFMAQGTPAFNILNLSYVSSEILHTLVGSFGLVLVAPLTAILGGFVYTKKPPKKNEKQGLLD